MRKRSAAEKKKENPFCKHPKSIAAKAAAAFFFSFLVGVLFCVAFAFARLFWSRAVPIRRRCCIRISCFPRLVVASLVWRTFVGGIPSIT